MRTEATKDRQTVRLSQYYPPIPFNKAIKTKTVRCETWCGGGERICSKTNMDTAARLAKRTAKALGRGWTPVLNHNLGWYAHALSPCKRINVGIHRFNHRFHYTAFLGEGQFAMSGSTAKAAVRNVLRVARVRQRSLNTLLEGL
jgi:hypothetical protein